MLIQILESLGLCSEDPCLEARLSLQGRLLQTARSTSNDPFTEVQGTAIRTKKT